MSKCLQCGAEVSPDDRFCGGCGAPAQPTGSALVATSSETADEPVQPQPVADRAEYRLSWAGAATPTMLKFRALPKRPLGLEDTASFLMSNQCDAQLDLFIETVRAPDAAAPAG